MLFSGILSELLLQDVTNNAVIHFGMNYSQPLKWCALRSLEQARSASASPQLEFEYESTFC